MSRRSPALAPADGPSQTLAKGLRILDLLTQTPDGMRATEVARRFDLNLNTAGRLLATLEASGFATRNPRGEYALGAKIIAAAVRRLNIPSVANLAHPYLVALRDATSETALLVSRVGSSLVLLDVVEGKHDLRVVQTTGSLVPLFPAPTGFAITVDLPAKEAVELSRKIGDPLRVIRETDVLSARNELQKHGYLVRHAALSSAGTCTVAMTVRHGGAAIAAIGIAGPSQRWNEKAARPHAKLFRQVAHDLSKALART
jgi:DNA-binding IclR family transcriptional regulator